MTRLHTAVGQVLAPDMSCLPIIVDLQDFVLRQNEALMVHIVAAANIEPCDESLRREHLLGRKLIWR